VTWSPSHGQSAQGAELKLLIDGAHNPAAAAALRPYVDYLLAGKATANSPNPSVTWIMGMLATKDHSDIFRALLRPGDRLHLVPVPGHLSESTETLAAIAKATCSQLAQCQSHRDVMTALETVASAPAERMPVTVLCGSLYLVGDFLHRLKTQA
ncbi:MAG: bifunctional folylpolyglutamate synthase/dihydrofolate synthase, partial [Cyanobacteria bacterium J06659_2]